MTFLKPGTAAALAGCDMLETFFRDPWNRVDAGDVIARNSATTPFPPTVHNAALPSGGAPRMVPPPHSGAPAPERRGGAAVERRWAGALRLGARQGRGA